MIAHDPKGEGMVAVRQPESYILGIDLGTNSLGWACIKIDQNGEPIGLLRTGVRIFRAGTEGDITSGKDESRKAKRRAARQARRQLARRRRRALRLFHLLQKAGLLPDGDTPHEVIQRLDKTIFDARLDQPGFPYDQLVSRLPYVLRAAALDQRLEPHEIGRALYHLAQRRGYLSNRREDAKERIGPVLSGIAEIERRMKERGARTLGELFALTDPHSEPIRRVWTSRAMYLDEFDAIWEAQRAYHPALLSDELKLQVRRAIFHQRPLKSVKRYIGECELEPGRKRAPRALPSAQRWRFLQVINNLQLISIETGEKRPLTSEERLLLVDELDRNGKLTFAKMRKLLGLDSRRWTTNLEEGGARELQGDATGARIRNVIGRMWDDFDLTQRDELVDELLSVKKEETLVRRLMVHWGLTEEQARELASLALPDGYVALSRKAIARVLPYLEQGVPYPTARLRAYPDADKPRRSFELLPPLVGKGARHLPQSLRAITNPIVARSLNQVRVVVNAIVREYGKPAFVHVELARDLKKSKTQREEIAKEQRDREKERERARERLLKELGLQQPSAQDIEKVLLADEQEWQCIYTGRSFGMSELINSGALEVDHIIPWSWCFDNTRANKVVCLASANREKGNRTPRDAFGGDIQRWNEILARAERLQQHTGSLGRKKFERLQWTREEVENRYSDFAERQLNDTRYAARLAADYIGLLFGGRIDENHRRVVKTLSGPITAILRREWGLNGILTMAGGEATDRKSRDDHRHHAIDAIVIALCTEAMVQRLARMARSRESQGDMGTRLLVGLDAPWPSFRSDVEAAIKEVVPSHELRRRVRGALHEETNYGVRGDVVYVRKKITSLTPREVGEIVDPRVRTTVETWLASHGQTDPRRLGSAPPPLLVSRDGKPVPIKKVRIRVRSSTVRQVGAGERLRNVEPGSNHHAEIFALPEGKNGRPRWTGRVVTLLEAYHRVRQGQPIVEREWAGSEKATFLFSLASGDLIRLAGQIFVVRSIWLDRGAVRMQLSGVSDAQPTSKSSRAGLQPMLSVLAERSAERVVVDPLGRVHPCRD
ncbi:MAG: type II CRISPR RNA-guided endonuclease Cas9 [Acidothermus sp.]|nr:type II CRISPR RNA-guided endonuclease Cas9 [Acidothermus sp.]